MTQLGVLLAVWSGLLVIPSFAQERSDTQHRMIGVGSCSAAGCHGGDRTSRRSDGSIDFSRTSFRSWIERDPHAGAYDVLFSTKSRQMVQKLGWADAHRESRCLTCHSTHQPGSDVKANADLLLDGVSCEACHGPAEKWLVPHTSRTWRGGLTAADRAALGFVDLRQDLTQRGKTCAQCHVGGPGRDVNHDLIAAGHPRLSFELSAYHANLVKKAAHWDVAGDQRAFPVADNPAGSMLEARLWVIGQLTTGDAALNLLEERAGSVGKAPWPEFSEYSCFACHHDLQAPSWRQGNVASGRKAGSYPWGTWNSSLLTVALFPRARPPFVESIKGLDQTMSSPFPDPTNVLNSATTTRATLQLELSRHRLPDSLTTADIQRLLQQVTHDGQDLSQRDWDSAAQVYLATVSLHQADRLAKGRAGLEPQVEPLLKSLRDQLSFPAKFDSPRDYGKSRIDLFRQQLSKLEGLVTKP